MSVAAVVLLADAAWRARAILAGRYAPSLLRFVVPSDLLRPRGSPTRPTGKAERRALGSPRDLAVLRMT
jgi:hypothetical protein